MLVATGRLPDNGKAILFSCLWNADEFIVTGELPVNGKAIPFPDMEVLNGCE